MRVPDPRSFRHLADAELQGLDPGLRSLLDFMSCRLDAADDPAKRGFWALLLGDVLREARSGFRDPFLGRMMEARLATLLPGEPAPAPFTLAEAHGLYFAMDSLSPAARSPSTTEARVRSVISERLLQRRRR